MADLTVPSDANTKRIKALVQNHVELGDTVEVRSEERTEDRMMDVTGEVTGLEPAYLELDGRSLAEGSVRYDEINSVSILESS